jgi:hypothetical protein
MNLDADTSLARQSVSALRTQRRTFNQHPKPENPVLCGLTSQDDYMSHELGLEAVTTAWDFSERCAELVDTAIFDLSGSGSTHFCRAQSSTRTGL